MHALKMTDHGPGRLCDAWIFARADETPIRGSEEDINGAAKGETCSITRSV